MCDKYVRYAIYAVAALIILAIAGLWAWKHFTGPSDTVIMQPADTQDVAKLQQQLDISKKEAEQLRTEMAKAAARAPAVSYYVEAPTTQEAAKVVEKQIEDDRAPVELPKADKTIITPQEQKVDVYRITLDKPRGIGVYVSTESIGAIAQYKNVAVFGGPKYDGGYEIGTAYMIRW